MIKVLCVDDSALIREVLAKHLSQYPDIEVVGTAANPYIARDRLVELNPDVMTLDIEMPRMDGVEFLTRLMPQYPIPVVVFSSLTPEGGVITLNALEAGAVDFVTKPGLGVQQGIIALIDELAGKIRMAARVSRESLQNRARQRKQRTITPIRKSNILTGSTDKVIALGASTGGTEAMRVIVETLPADLPGMVVVQHMPPVMTEKFAMRLNELSALEIKEAKDGDRILNGHVLIAPGGKHMTVERSGGTYVVRVFNGEKVQGHAPSVEVLFNSIAKNVGSNAYGIMLTGMGRDGAAAMVEMKKAGSRNIVQDEQSSVVWGMPGEAYKMGAADFLLPIEQIAQKLVHLVRA